MSRSEPKILVVEDEDPVRGLLGKLLERGGHCCTLAADAQEARRYLQGGSFDLVLCDIRMPGESGIDLIQHLKSAYPDTAILMVTAIDDPETAKVAMDIGAYGYIVKPFYPNQVLISVANALRRRELEQREKRRRKELEEMVQHRTAELLQVNQQLREKQAALEEKTRELEETNSALRVLLKKREEDREELEDKVLASTKRLVIPCLERLKASGLNARQWTYLNLLEANLKEITSGFAKTLSSELMNLTPTEIQIADFIRQGKRTKEIAAILNLSENTIISHRYRLRSKLGLKNRKINLRTYLHSLT